MGKEYDNLLVILKLFQNRPNHLSKFLIDSKALNPDFINKLKDSEKIKQLKENGIHNNHLHFDTISEMKDYYSSLIDDLENIKQKKTGKELIEEFNSKLKLAIDKEDYEEASRIRDYMKLNNIPKLN